MAKTNFQRQLEGRISQVLSDRAASIATGACADWAEYKYQCGFLFGLKAVLDLCSEIEQED